MPPAAADYEIVARYNSSRNQDNVYEVYRYASGELRCSCPGWRFSRVQPKTCRHIKRVEQGLDDDVAVMERQDRAMKLVAVCRATGTYNSFTTDESFVRSIRRALAGETGRDAHLGASVLRFLDALDASGLFAPRASKPEVVRSRGTRVITLDD